MPDHDHIAFLHSLGWLAALMFVALLPSFRQMAGQRHATWLMAFCASRLLVAAQEFVNPAPSGRWSDCAALLGGMLLWEFARRVWNDHGRHISAATHIVAVECLALIGATATGSGEGPPAAWLIPIELVFAALPVLLGGAAILLLWRHLTHPALRLATVALGLFGLAAIATPLALLLPWTAAAALAAPMLARRETRTRAALACLGGFLVLATAGPLAISARLGQIHAQADAGLIERAERATVPLQGSIAARLATETPPSRETRRQLSEHTARLRATDPLLHGISLWQVRETTVHRVDLAGNDDAPPLDAARVRGAGLDPFVQWQAARPGLVRAHAPVRGGVFENASAWLALDYPAVFWDLQRAHARRTGIALISLLAGFCAMGFVLTGRHAIERAQQLEIERAQSADKAKTEFLAFLSHEMRTPLQTILGRTELLQIGATATEASRHHGAAIETQGRLLLRLVTDLLDLGTLEAGKFRLRPHPFSLRQALAAVEDTVRAPAATKGLAFTMSVASDVPDQLIGDETRLRQVLGNVLGNAVKYTSRGEVTLHVTSADSGPATGDESQRTIAEEHSLPTATRLLSPELCPLVFTVTDTGPGLPPDKIPQLFTLFTRLDSGDTFTREGTGVGLALVRRLCELMGGTATAANRPEGGAIFTVRLAFPVDGNATSAPANTTSAPTAGLHVLVAEDNAPARAFLIEALQSLGHRAEGAPDGPATIAAATAQHFDAVLIDVNLPGIDGVTIARTLAAQPHPPRLIGCSAEAFAHTREAALAAGMDAFLEKPVSLAALARALQPVAAAATPTASANLFERLRAPELIAQTRATLTRDLPAMIVSLQVAHDSGDTAALRRQAHFLLSTALLADDATLVQLCRQLEHEADAGVNDRTSTILSELNRHAASAAS